MSVSSKKTLVFQMLFIFFFRNIVILECESGLLCYALLLFFQLLLLLIALAAE